MSVAQLFASPAGQMKNFKRSEDGCCIEYDFPGLHCCNFARDGNPSIQSLMKMCGQGDDPAFTGDVNKTLFAYDWLVEYERNFSFLFRMKISKLMYDGSIPKQDLRYKLNLSYIGNTSFQVNAKFFIKWIQEPVLEYSNLTVCISDETRLPKPLPSWMLQKFKQSGLKEQVPERVEKFNRPLQTFVNRVCVAWSDTDTNSHCNFASYAKYFDDAVHAAIRQKESEKTSTLQDRRNNSSSYTPYEGDPVTALHGITSQHLNGGAKDFRIAFFKECL